MTAPEATGATRPASVPPRRRTARRIPRPSEIRQLVQLDPISPRPATNRLRRALTVEDLREAARRRVPRSVFEFVDGGAEDELTMRRTREAFERVEFRPTVLNGASEVDITTSLFGRPSALPLVLGPTGFCRLSHHEGERAVARAAALGGIPFALTTMGTVSIEDVAAVGGPDADRWFQLYIMRDRGLTAELVQRAKTAGYSVLVVTVDTPVTGQRRKDVRNGFSVPPKLTPRTLLDISRRPEWWINLLTTEPLVFATVPAGEPEAHARFIDGVFDPSATFADLAQVRAAWDGPLVVKGIQTVEDAYRALDAGADGVVLSSHGGRQLDRSPVALEVLPRVADELGDRLEILLDSGVRTGADIAAAVALGAKACLVGRPYLYGLMAGGEAGVRKVIDIYAAELRRSLHLLGLPSVAALGPGAVRLR
ncbi:alpha-hydroxy-acid oxidizing enzyme [Nakamurella sp. YIM 132087]|uniref:Alpha-hydroxy-acid oxidizing enzyme n=1 Tax=Nakamurella alba TaxID=2665158 RepID=A0A7K1FN12_9ACTN|nr:alpha-hydroxy acid oxidase [Nakamurella alba]MTD14709.1 alpha-hydroxy-acid oxidizing enzyme [Nakamurella alba]